jgi:signal transduction histidine kinase
MESERDGERRIPGGETEKDENDRAESSWFSPRSFSSASIESSERPRGPWFRALTIEERILIGFGIVFLGILAICALSYRNIRVLLDNSSRDTKSYGLLQLLRDIDGATDEAEKQLRRYLVTGDQLYFRNYEEVAKQRREAFQDLHGLVRGAGEQEQRAEQLGAVLDRQFAAQAQAIAKFAEGGIRSVKKMAFDGVAKREIDEIHRIVVEMDRHEREALHRRGTASTAETRTTSMLLAAGAFLQLVLLASVYYLIRHDITQRRRVADELKRHGLLLEAANKELESFSYSVSHDLRAPLRHIDGYAALLRKAMGDALNERAARYLDTISASAQQMGQLIDDLLMFSRMGRHDMVRTTVDLGRLVSEVLEGLRLDLQERRISWTIDPLPLVTGDPAMLRQVFVNLIGNAVKFTSTKPTAEIAVGVDRRTATEVVVFVRDNGVGFDMRYASKLFGVFQRLHRADEFEGTGIGLANVRRIVHRHGGRVWAEGVPNQGATFYVALPTGEGRA